MFGENGREEGREAIAHRLNFIGTVEKRIEVRYDVSHTDELFHRRR